MQLYNRGSVPVSVGGLYLSGHTRVPGQWKLPALSVEPGQVLTVREGAPGTARLGAILDPERPEVSLYSAPLKPGEAYGRQPRGAESFGGQPGP